MLSAADEVWCRLVRALRVAPERFVGHDAAAPATLVQTEAAQLGLS